MNKLLYYPGGLKAYSQLECMQARVVKEQFIEQCAVLKYTTKTPSRFTELPTRIHEELGSDIANMIDGSRVYESTRTAIVLHLHFHTRDAGVSAVKKRRKRQAIETTPGPALKLYPMFTSKKRYSIYTINLPLDSPSNAYKEVYKALVPTNRVIVHVVLAAETLLKKYNGTATIVLQGEGNISVTLYGKNYTIQPVKDVKGYLYCVHCTFLNDHDTE